MKKCCIDNEDCNNNLRVKRNLCNTHYMRFRKYGDPFFLIPKIIKICMEPECNEKVLAKERCQYHYSQIPERKNADKISGKKYRKSLKGKENTCNKNERFRKKNQVIKRNGVKQRVAKNV